MLTKSIRLTREDAIGVSEIIEKDPRIERGPSEALHFCFQDAAADIPTWANVVKYKPTVDPNIQISDDYAETKTFLVDEQDFKIVVDSFKEQLNLTKVRISYMTRLCIMVARMRLDNQGSTVEAKPEVKVTIENVNGVALIQKLAELLQAEDEESKKKVQQIREALEGGSEHDDRI